MDKKENTDIIRIMEKVGIVLGTRPEIIKMAPIIRECQKRDLNFFIIHTNQHYSKNLDEIFFQELNLPKPDYNLKIGQGFLGEEIGMSSGSHGDMTGRMVIGIERILLKERPSIVFVQGDTNTALSGALAASKIRIPVSHIEAGIRSRFREMPEEINRILADQCADFLFAPTQEAEENLLKEGIEKEKIFIVGNTVVDSLLQILNIADSTSKILDNLKLKEKEYFLTTFHREENVDNQERLEGILKGLEKVSQEFNLPIIYPIHPRTKKMIDVFKISIPENIRVIDPIGYLDFIKLQSKAKLILTDSGGLQEEACVLRVPCVTLRDNTERPDTLVVGSNILAGADSEKILKSAIVMLKKKLEWENPFGEGDSAKQTILKIIENMNSREIKHFYKNYGDKIQDKKFASPHKIRHHAHRATYMSSLWHIKPNERVLEVGCGEGILSVMMAKKGADVTGIDISSANIEAARKLAEKEGVNIEFLEADAENLPFADNSFDLVVADNVLEHLPNFEKGLSEIKRVMKKKAIIALPTCLNPCAWALLGKDVYWKITRRTPYAMALGLLKVILNKALNKKGVNEGYASRENLPHLWRYPKKMKKELENAGLKITSFEPATICLPYFDFLLPVTKFLDKHKTKPILKNLGFGSVAVVEKY